jgi:hypothetical protein
MPSTTKKAAKTQRRRPVARRPRAAISPAPGAAAATAFSPAAASFIAAAVADGLAIQHRFKAEPVYARTGKGFMAPAGVAEIADAKRASKLPAHKR